MYEDISYDYAIENGIAIIAESDVFIYKKYIEMNILGAYQTVIGSFFVPANRKRTKILLANEKRTQ